MPSAPITTPIRVAIVDDHEVVRDGLASVLATESDIELVAAVESVATLVARHAPVDLVVLDLRVNDRSTPESNVEALRAWGAESLVYTGGEDPELIRSAARAGVLGVLRKSSPAHEIVAAIRAAAAGGMVPTSEWAAAIDGDVQLADAKLSLREQEVLALYASGLKAQEVAERTALARETIANYVSRIRAKYAGVGRPAPTKVDLLRRALEDGLIDE